jgi:uncharacterized protein YndB with AHSA1/START domain
MTLRAAHEIDVPPQRAADVILSPEGTKKWFGNIKSLEADPTWPRVGSRMKWTIGKNGQMAFNAQVVENHLPESLTMLVQTPSAQSTITHRFQGLPGSRTLYVKTVEAAWRNKVFGPLMGWLIIQPSMRREVRRAAEIAAPTTRPRT